MDKDSRRKFLEKLDKDSLIERLMVAEELLNEERVDRFRRYARKN